MMAINPKHIVNLKGKDHVLYAGLLDAAVAAGLKSIEVTLLQFPAPENGHLAISTATVVFDDGRLFSEVGDAGPQNCSASIAAAACRMSATRAKGRALRDALNIGEAMVEEFGPDADDQPRHNSARATQDGPQQRAKHDPQDQTTKTACAVCGAAVPAAVANAGLKEFSEVLCLAHGKERRARRAEVETVTV